MKLPRLSPLTANQRRFLLILLCTNVALLAIVLNQNFQERQAQQQAREDAILFLQQEGVQVEEDTVPKSTTLVLQKAERDRSGEKKLAAALLGEDASVQDRGGGVYLYSSAAGSVQFHSDGSFQAALEPSAFPMGEQTAEEHGKQLMSRLGFTARVLAAEEIGERLATFAQMILDGGSGSRIVLREALTPFLVERKSVRILPIVE